MWTSELVSPDTSITKKRDALKFLLHIMGDVCITASACWSLVGLLWFVDLQSLCSAVVLQGR
jgi:hypothetical protein